MTYFQSKNTFFHTSLIDGLHALQFKKAMESYEIVMHRFLMKKRKMIEFSSSEKAYFLLLLLVEFF